MLINASKISIFQNLSTPLYLMALDPVSALTAAKQAKEGFSLINSVILWVKRKVYPKTPTNSTGIVIAILTEDAKNREQLKNDFINTIEQLLESSNAKKPFHIIDLPIYHAEKIKTFTDAGKVLDKCRSKFIIWGIARKRNFDNKSYLVLDLECGVSHNEIIIPISMLLAQEMNELLPKRRKISGENDLIELEINATSVELAARYIIGETSYLSDDVEYALELFQDLYIKLVNLNIKEIPVELKQHIQILTEKTIINLTHINFEIAAKYQTVWRKTRNPRDIDKMIEYVKNNDSLVPRTYDSAILWSLYHFVKNQDIKLAREILAPWKKIYVNDATFAFNEAFLCAYEGRLREATKYYKIAFRRNHDSRLLLEIEEFLEWILSENPEKYQINYSLGLINYFGKEEFGIATNYFNKFLESTSEGQYKEQINLVRNYINDIENTELKKQIKKVSNTDKVETTTHKIDKGKLKNKKSNNKRNRKR